jgi:elongation factor G
MANDITKPLPLIAIAVEPKSKADQEKLGSALAALMAEDPLFHVYRDQESGQTIIQGMSEAQLDTKAEILKSAYGIDANFGPPQVAYREKLIRSATVIYTHKRQVGGSGEYAEVKIVAEPLPAGSTPSFVFSNEVVGGAVPEAFIAGAVRGLESVLGSGVLAGFPVDDLKVSLVDGRFHQADSSERAFEIAARMALREALQKGGVVLLEPVMKIEIVTPEDSIGSITGDLKSRRGQIQSQDMRGDASVITATAPLANMFSYGDDLRALSQGRATLTMQFDHWAIVPLWSDDDPPFQPAAAMRA